LLVRWRAGSSDAEDRLMSAVQSELRRIAARYLRRERAGHTLQPTAVVHEAYLRLIPQRTIPWENRAHFYGIAARMMRRVLVDHARRRQAAKRSDREAHAVPLSEIVEPAPAVDLVDVLSLHNALSELAELDARQANIVEMRYFGGLTVEEIADCLKISPATVKREWATARLWLRRRMQAG
jgi:RNA polymerase sigma-70 factor (ECF subfamily)